MFLVWSIRASVGVLIIGSGRIGRHETSCVFSVFTAHFQVFCCCSRLGGGGLNSVRPSRSLSSVHLRAGTDDHDQYDEDYFDENNDKILLMTVIIMLLKTMMTVVMMMLEMIKLLMMVPTMIYVHDHDHYDDD